MKNQLKIKSHLLEKIFSFIEVLYFLTSIKRSRPKTGNTQKDPMFNNVSIKKLIALAFDSEILIKRPDLYRW